MATTLPTLPTQPGTTAAPSTSSPPSSTSSAVTTPSTTTAGTPSTSSASSATTSASTTQATTTALTTTAAATVIPTGVTTSKPTTSGRGGVITQTQTSFVVSQSGGLPTESAGASSSKGFFQNTGAVAGVFSVVGIIGLALIIALITNAVRRRRAHRFDKELREATLEAAQAPAIILDDDEDDQFGRGGRGYNNSGSGEGYAGNRSGGFSDVSSHGTYGQPPMETYNMREMGPGPGVGEIYDPYAAGGAGVGAAGAAGIGVARARSTHNPAGYAAALKEGASPYPAFAAPSGGSGTSPGHGRGNNADLLEAAGLGASAAAPGFGQSRYNQQYHPQYQPQQQMHQRSPSQKASADLNRNRSLATREAQSGYVGQGQVPPASAATTATQYHSPTDAYSSSHSHGGHGGKFSPPPPAGGFHALSGPPQQQYPQQEEDMDAYGGYVADSPSVSHPADKLPNPFDAGSGQGHDKSSRESVYSDEEEMPQKRVLKIANE